MLLVMNDDLLFPSVIGLIIGLYLIIKSIKKHSKLSSFKENGIATKGLIFMVKESYRLVNDDLDDGQTYKTVYYPVVEYQDEKGKKLVSELRENYSQRKNSIKIGRIVNLVYDKEKPHLVKTQEEIDNIWVPIIFLSIGFILFFYSLFILYEYFDN